MKENNRKKMTISKTQPHIDLDEYIRQGEPSQKEKASIWQTAIGLQAVDGLHTSEYLRDTACKHIEGEIGIDEARELIRTYYQSKTLREPDDEEKQEADNVSANITKILSSQTLDFSTGGYISVQSALRWTTVFLLITHGISAMPWFVRIIRTLLRVLIIHQYI